MSIKKFFIQSDTTIYNALKPSFLSRSAYSNTGLSDSLEVFFLYGQDPRATEDISDKLEEARILVYPNLQNIYNYYVDFPTDTKFVLRLFNAEHPFTLPRRFTLELHSIDSEWDEGTGLDMETYSDIGAASWIERKTNVNWITPGALPVGSQSISTQFFDIGVEDMEIDITDWIENNWNAAPEASFIITLSPLITDGSQTENIYTKKFFSRSSEFFFKRPVIEARTSDAIFDDRGKMYKASSAYNNNTQNLYLYNYVNGQKESFSGLPVLEIFETSDLTQQPIVVGVVSETEVGVYKSEIEIPEGTSVETVYEKWSVNGVTVKTGEMKVLEKVPSTDTGSSDYFVSITNLKNSYSTSETAKFRLYTRLKDWNPTIYTLATGSIENNIIDKAYYKIVRLIDDEIIIGYGKGSDSLNNEHTRLSYDEKGSYFSLDMSLLESGYMYGIKFMFSLNGEELEQPEIFKFRVD